MREGLLAEVARDPDWYLHRVDAVEDQAVFHRSDRQSLASTLFLDGRTPYVTTDTCSVSLTDLGRLTGSAAQSPFIFHMSFCGSTQLAHLIGVSGAGTVLKEPQALVDLSDWQRTLTERGIQDQRFAPALNASVALLSRNWSGSPPTVIKPSNWANTLIPMLTKADSRIVLVTIERRAFLQAVFRGGHDRLTFTARVASHFAKAAGRAQHLNQAITSVDDPLDQMARLILVAHDLQQRLFADVARQFNLVRIDQRLISEDPHAALERACEALGLILPEGRLTAIDRLKSLDAKDPAQPFSAAQQLAENALVERHHGKRFDAALAWADETAC